MSLSNILALILPWATVIALYILNRVGLKTSEKERAVLQKTLEKSVSESESEKRKSSVSSKVSDIIAEMERPSSGIDLDGMVSSDDDAIRIAREQAERAYSQQETR